MDGTVEPLVLRNTPLPTTGLIHGLRTTQAVDRQSGAGLISIPILSGEHSRADRNTVIGQLDLRAHDMVRDVPRGTEVEVTVHVDTSFRIKADAFIPFLDAEFPIEVDLARPVLPTFEELTTARAALEARYHDLRGQADEIGAVVAAARLDRVDSDGLLDEIDRLLRQAEADQDAVATCQSRLLQADTALDEVDELLALPRTIEEGRTAQDIAREVVEDSGGGARAAELRRAEADLEEAIADGNRTVIERRTAAIRQIAIIALHDSGQLPLARFSGFAGELDADPRHEVQRLLADGRTAVAAGDVAQIERINARLARFIDHEPAPQHRPEHEGRLGREGRRR
ncbi:hypothetical protein [Promicromonospora sp. NPDC057488]|uniref:hypothetical protein n=1 Tax=Promicromonospora sp. NPDC057488 TaxID=3346147 RepID=UPI00366B68B2